jgi:TonB family protein
MPPTVLRVGGEVKAPVVMKRVEPNVERCTTTKIRVSGVPLLEAVIDENGVPRDIRILESSHPCVDQVVIEAVEQWRFRPATLRGKAVPVVFNMTVHVHYE